MTEQSTSNMAPKVDEDGMPSFSSLQSAESLHNLRDLVKQASKELRRLKNENAALAARIQELEDGPKVDSDAAMLVFDEEPEQLRTSVKGFIQAIDSYLAEDEE